MPTVTAGETTGTAFSEASMERYERAKLYRDQSIVWLIPTRGSYPCEVVDAWDVIQWPPNQFRSCRIAVKGKEVAAAYNDLFEMVVDEKKSLDHFAPHYVDQIMKTKFVWTTEEDNIIPSNVMHGLFNSMYTCPDCGGEVMPDTGRCRDGHKGYDAVSGLYFMKTEPPVPMAFGDPKEPGDFKPRSIREAVRNGDTIEVNGIAMGCAIWRRDLFYKVSRPWFETSQTYTQDMYFCKKAKDELGWDNVRFGVNCGVKVGHLNPRTGQIV